MLIEHRVEVQFSSNAFPSKLTICINPHSIYFFIFAAKILF